MSRLKGTWVSDVVRALRAVEAEGVASGEDVRGAMSCSKSQAYQLFSAKRDLRLLELADDGSKTWRIGPRSKAWMDCWGLRL